MWQTYLTVAVVSYLLGSIPFGYILVKLFLKQDIRQTGSGNIGATNVARSGKKGLAIATLLLDAAKGYFGVLLSLELIRRLGEPGIASTIPSGITHLISSRILEAYWTFKPFSFENLFRHDVYSLAAVASLAAIAGHCFPIWLRFKGGKGVATALGAFLFVCPVAVGISFLSFVVVFAITRIVSASSIVAAIAFAVATPRMSVRLAFSFNRWILIAACLVVILKHHANIRRLLNGTEPKFSTKKSAVPSDPIQAEKNA